MRVLMLDFGIFMLASLLMGSSCIPPPCPQTHLGPKLESKTHDKNKEQDMCERENIQESAKGSTSAKLAKWLQLPPKEKYGSWVLSLL